MELGPLEVLELAHARAALRFADAWLDVHPRGHIDIQPDSNGRIVTYSDVHPETGHEEGGTGFGPTLADALIGAFRECDWEALRKAEGELHEQREYARLKAKFEGGQQ